MINDRRIKLACMAKKPLVEPFEERLLQGHSYDLTLGDEFIVFEDGDLPFEFKKSDIEEYFSKVVSDEFILEPNKFILATTIEKVNMPKDLTAIIMGKSSIGRLGLLIHDAGFIDAGFEGQVTLEIKNLNSFPIKLVKGMKICQIIFFEVAEAQEAYSENRNTYQGQVGVTAPRLNKIVK